MKSLEIVNYWISARYKNKNKTIAWINGTGSQLESISDCYADMTYNIDDAEGEQLDFIASLVDIERALTSITGSFFGYIDTPDAVGYEVDTYYDHSGESLVPIQDYLFRIAIKAKIVKNTTLSLATEIEAAAEFVLNTDVDLVDNDDMTFYFLVDDISPEVGSILRFYNLEIKPAGVEFLGYQYRSTKRWFQW